MLDKFYYENNRGERVVFGGKNIFVNHSDLRDYQWMYDAENELISNIRRGVSEKTLPAIFVGSSGEECISARNNAFVTFERDVIEKKKGRICIGDYYLNCWIFATANTEYLYTERYLKTEFRIVTDDPAWHRKKLMEFRQVSIDRNNGIDFPFEFLFDFQVSPVSTESIINDFAFGNTDFIITIYGPAQDPSIKIGGHTYRMNCTLYDGERIIINSAKKTISRFGIDGSIQNYFNHRYKQESIFQKIADGRQELIWNGTFGFDLELVDSVSEPPWIWTESASTAAIKNEKEEMQYYLVDSDGRHITDSDGNYIIVSPAEGKD